MAPRPAAAPPLLLLLLLAVFVGCCRAQEAGEECLALFQKGRDDFVLDTDDSVKDGATFISSPPVQRAKDCVASCCKESKCNVALMQGGSEEGLISSCFLFDCLYKKKYACRFVRKKGYNNYILNSLYENYMSEEVPQKKDDRPPVANGGLDRVVQPQDTVMLNGIESKDDEEIASYQWQMLTKYPYAVMEKTNFPDQVLVSNLTSGMYHFQLTVTDNVGQSDTAKVTVLVLTPEQSEHHCMAPKKVGPCRGSFPRWHYNGASEKCEKFMYGGCRENLNNYLSKDECTNACYGTEKRGTGRGLPVPAPAEEKCGVACTAQQFTCTSGCCLDPGLECDTVPQCTDGSDEKNCQALDDNFQLLLQIPLDEQKVRCTEPPHTGGCRDTFTKWYYDPLQQECLRFNYGGCEGNDNRFDSQESCMRTCKGVTDKDVFARKQEFERQVSHSQTGIIAIAALLGVCIFILLAVLVYCLMKGKKKSTQHQRVAVNNAPLTSIEDRERLVYNSTTKPI